MIATGPDDSLVKNFKKAGGEGKPLYGKTTVCVASSEEEAKSIAHRIWPNSAVHGDPMTDLTTPRHFESVLELVTKEQVAEAVLCKQDAENHIKKINEYREAGFDHICVHQVGPDQESFFSFYEKEILPNL